MSKQQLEVMGRAAIKSAQKVLPAYQARRPNDHSVEKAINAANAYWDNPCSDTMNKAADAAADLARHIVSITAPNSPSHDAAYSALNAVSAAAWASKDIAYARKAAQLASTLADKQSDK